MKINISDITGTQTPINSDNIDVSCENMSGLKINNIYYSASANPETNSIDVNSGLYINSIDCSVLNSLKNNRYCPYRIDVNNGNITLTEEGNGYINVYDEDGIIQFYANYSSPDSDELNEEYKSYVFAIKHDEELILPEYDNAYIYYNNYSYTYTEGIIPLDMDDSFKYNIYAYDYFINTNNLTQNINVNTQLFEHTCDNNFNGKIFVNEKSDTSYILKLGNGSSVITRSDNIIPEEESSNNNIRKFKLSNIIEKSQQIDSTCLDDKSTEYYVVVSYSYLCKNEDNEYDGILHTDGLQYLSGSNNRYGVHVWGLENPALTTTSFKYENGQTTHRDYINDSSTTGLGRPIQQARFHFNATNNLKNIVSDNFNSYFNLKCNLSYLTNEIDNNTYIQSNIITLPMNYSISNNHIISIDSFNNQTQKNSLLNLFKILYNDNYNNIILNPLTRNNCGLITFNYNIEGLHNGNKVQYANEINKNTINKKVCVTQLPMSIVDKHLEFDIELFVYDPMHILYYDNQNFPGQSGGEHKTRILLNYIDLRFIPTKSDNEGKYNTADYDNIITYDNITADNDNDVSRVMINIPTIFHLLKNPFTQELKDYITIDGKKIHIATKSPKKLRGAYAEQEKEIFESISINIEGKPVNSVSDLDLDSSHDSQSTPYSNRPFNFERKTYTFGNIKFNYGLWRPVNHPGDKIYVYDSSGDTSNYKIKIHVNMTFDDAFINSNKYEFLNICVNKSEVFTADSNMYPQYGSLQKSLLEASTNQLAPGWDQDYNVLNYDDYIVFNYDDSEYQQGDLIPGYYSLPYHHFNFVTPISGFYPDYEWPTTDWGDVKFDDRFRDCDNEILKTDNYYFGLYKSGDIYQNNKYRGIHKIKLWIGFPGTHLLNGDFDGNTSDNGSGDSSGDDLNNGNTNENNNENIENNFILSYRQNNGNNDITAIQNKHQEYYVGNFILRNNTSVNINDISITSIKITNNTGIIRTLNLEDNSKVVINNYNTTTQELLISILYYSTDTSMTVTYEYIHDGISATEIDNINLLFS